jgi:glycosyltransferase involved in cell wall biosynthesis
LKRFSSRRYKVVEMLDQSAMKGLFYLEGHSLAGSERVLQSIAEAARREGLDVAIASCGRVPSPLGTVWRDQGGRYDWLEADVSPQLRSSALAPVGFAKWWSGLVMGLRPDVILANSGGYPWHGTCLAAVRVVRGIRAEGAPRLYLAIHSTPEGHAEDGVDQSADREVAKSCDAIVVGSSELARKIAAARPELARRLLTVRYGVADPGEVVPKRASEPVLLGMAADMRGFRKGQMIFVRALSGLPRGGERWRAVVAGDGPGFAAASEAAAGLPVDFLGRLPFDGMSSFYRGLDVYVLASLQEGLSLTVLEAMAHGLPVVASDVGGHREAVVHGETGFLVPPGEVLALRETLMTLIRDPALRGAMGPRARARYAEFFTRDRYLRAWVRLLRGDRE